MFKTHHFFYTKNNKEYTSGIMTFWLGHIKIVSYKDLCIPIFYRCRRRPYIRVSCWFFMSSIIWKWTTTIVIICCIWRFGIVRLKAGQSFMNFLNFIMLLTNQIPCLEKKLIFCQINRNQDKSVTYIAFKQN